MDDPKTTWTSAVTGKDNVSLDIVRIFLALTGGTFVSLTLYSVLWRGHNFEGLDFCKGAAVLITGAGAALGLKRGTEPDPSCDVPPRENIDRGPS